MKAHLISLLKRSEKYTKTDMVYLASGTFWSNFNSVIMTGLAFIASIFFARYLTHEEYGMYQYVLSIAGIIGAFTLTGMNSAVTRAVARGHEGEFLPSVTFQLKASFLPMLAGFGIAAWYIIHNNNDLAVAFAWVAILLPLGSAFNTWVAYVGGKKLFRIGSYYGFVNNVATYIPILAALYFGRDFLWVIFANYLFTFLSSFLIHRHLTRKIPPNTVRDNETLRYGTHLSLMSIIGTAASQLDSFLVFHFIGSSALAVYSFATLIPERLVGILKFIPSIALPKLSSRSEEEVRSILKKRLWLLILLLAGAAAGYAAIAPWIFNTFFPAYGDSIRFTQVYSLSFFSLAALVVQTALTSQRKTAELYLFNIVAPLIRAGLMTGLMFAYGIWGLLWAQIINNFVSLGIQLTLVSRSKQPSDANIQTNA